MRKLLMVLVIAVGISACDSADPVGYSNIGVKEAHDVLLQGDKAEPFIFLDVRTLGEFTNGHVPGAVNIPIQTLSKYLAEVPKDRTVFVYCETGRRSTSAAEFLVESGFTNIINMKASMRGWRGSGYETER